MDNILIVQLVLTTGVAITGFVIKNYLKLLVDEIHSLRITLTDSVLQVERITSRVGFHDERIKILEKKVDES